MCSDMTHQMLIQRESLVTLGAGVLLLLYVSLYMPPQASPLCEFVYASSGKRLFTLKAGVGLLSCMDSTVFVEVTGLGEGLVSEGAGEGPISSVCPLVNI